MHRTQFPALAAGMAFLLAVTAPTFADGTLSGSDYNLLNRSDVQTDIKLSKKQLDQLQKILTNHQSMLLHIQQRVPFTFRNQKTLEAIRHRDQEILKVLTKKQVERIAQIQFQIAANGSILTALLRNPYDRQIRLSAQQKLQIQQLLLQEERAIDNLPRTLSLRKYNDLVQQLRDETMKQVRRVILSRQQQGWLDQLCGPDFEMSLQRRGFRP